MIILQLIRYYSKKNTRPFYRNEDLSEKMAMSSRQLQRYLHRLDEEKGYIRLVSSGGMPNRVDLTPLQEAIKIDFKPRKGKSQPQVDRPRANQPRTDKPQVKQGLIKSILSTLLGWRS